MSLLHKKPESAGENQKRIRREKEQEEIQRRKDTGDMDIITFLDANKIKTINFGAYFDYLKAREKAREKASEKEEKERLEEPDEEFNKKWKPKKGGKYSKRSKLHKKKSAKSRAKPYRKTKKMIRKGGYTFLENLNLDKYAKDPEIQFALQVYFKENVDNYLKAREILKANNHFYPSIKDLIKEIGVGPDAKESAQTKLMDAKGDRWNNTSSNDDDYQPQQDMKLIDRLVSNEMNELERQSRRVKVIEDELETSVRRPTRTIKATGSRRSYNSSNRQ